MASALTLEIIREFEDFRSTPYWDVNAWRVGYGSDTTTSANGTVTQVTKDTVTTREDAERDLVRRAGEFQSGIVQQVGRTAWSKLPDAAQAAVTSLAYNYGSLSGLSSLRTAIKSGDIEAIATAVENRGIDNNGVNKKRRASEATLIRTATLAAPNADRNVADQRAEQQSGRAPMPDRSKGAAAQTFTAASGNVYRVGAVYNSGKPGTGIYTITPTGIVKTGWNPTGEKTVLGGIIARETKKATEKVSAAVKPVIDAAGASVTKMGGDIGNAGGGVVSGIGTILGGMFGGGAPAKPAVAPAKSLADLNANLTGRGQPTPVPPTPALQSQATAAKRGAKLFATASPVIKASTGGTVLSPLTSPTILGEDVSPSGPTGPTMSRGAGALAVARRKLASDFAAQTLAQAEAKRAAALISAQTAAATMQAAAAAAAQMRLQTARAAQVTAQTAARTAAARLGQIVSLPYAPSSFDQQAHPDTNMAVYRANREAIGGVITQASINKALSEGKTLYKSQ